MNKKRPKQITFRASQEEYKIIQKKIKKSGLKTTRFFIKYGDGKRKSFLLRDLRSF